MDHPGRYHTSFSIVARFRKSKDRLSFHHSLTESVCTLSSDSDALLILGHFSGLLPSRPASVDGPIGRIVPSRVRLLEMRCSVDRFGALSVALSAFLAFFVYMPDTFHRFDSLLNAQ